MYIFLTANICIFFSMIICNFALFCFSLFPQKSIEGRNESQSNHKRTFPPTVTKIKILLQHFTTNFTTSAFSMYCIVRIILQSLLTPNTYTQIDTIIVSISPQVSKWDKSNKMGKITVIYTYSHENINIIYKNYKYLYKVQYICILDIINVYHIQNLETSTIKWLAAVKVSTGVLNKSP